MILMSVKAEVIWRLRQNVKIHDKFHVFSIYTMNVSIYYLNNVLFQYKKDISIGKDISVSLTSLV